MKNIQIVFLVILSVVIRTKSKKDNYQKDKIYIQINDDDDVFTIDLIQSIYSERLLNALPLSTYLLEENQYMNRLPISNVDVESNNLSFSTKANINAKKGDILLFKGKDILILNEDKVFEGEYTKIGNLKQINDFSIKIKKIKNFVTFSLINSIDFEEHEKRLRREHLINYFILKLITLFISVVV